MEFCSDETKTKQKRKNKCYHVRIRYGGLAAEVSEVDTSANKTTMGM